MAFGLGQRRDNAQLNCFGLVVAWRMNPSKSMRVEKPAGQVRRAAHFLLDNSLFLFCSDSEFPDVASGIPL